jgi:hypothetical protein
MRFVQIEKSASLIVKEPAMDRIFDQAEEKESEQRTESDRRPARYMLHSKISEDARATEIDRVTRPVVDTAIADRPNQRARRVPNLPDSLGHAQLGADFSQFALPRST